MSTTLTAGTWVNAPADRETFHAWNPTTGEAIERSFPISTWADLDLMASAATDASETAHRRGIVPDTLTHRVPYTGRDPRYRGADRRIFDQKMLHGGGHALYSRRRVREQPGGGTKIGCADPVDFHEWAATMGC